MGKEATHFKPGNPGRPKGAQGKTLARSRINQFVNDNWDKFETELKGLNGKSFVENFLKLMPYITPAFQSINFSLQNMSDDDLEFLAKKIREIYGTEN